MSFAKIANSALILSVALQGSSAAVLPERRFLLRADQVDVVDHTEHKRVHNPGDIIEEIVQHERPAPADIVDVVKRAPQGVEVAESEVLQLIDDVRAVELQMQDWLGGVTITTPSLTADDVSPAESGNPVEDVDLPSVSDTSRDELINEVENPLDIDAAATTESSEAPSSDGCMMTVTETFTEFIFHGPSSTDVALRAGNETGSPNLVAFETSLTVGLPLDPGLESTSVPLESISLESTPLGDSPLESSPLDRSPLESLPVDENLVPFALSEDLEALPISTLADLWEAAAPSITPPPAVTDDPILEGADGSDDEIDLLNEEDTVAEESVEGPEEDAPEEDGDEEDEQQVVTPPTEMSLRFPGEGPSDIVWRTISLPTV